MPWVNRGECEGIPDSLWVRGRENLLFHLTGRPHNLVASACCASPPSHLPPLSFAAGGEMEESKCPFLRASISAYAGASAGSPPGLVPMFEVRSLPRASSGRWVGGGERSWGPGDRKSVV